MRKIWNKYYSESSCIIFMIDGTDQLRFSEVKETLNDLYGEDSELSDKPLLFVLNKADSETFTNDIETILSL